MMAEEERYEQVDMPFYREEIAPILPPEVLDFHTHTWRADDWKEAPWEMDPKGGKYMVITPEYTCEELVVHGKSIFPDRKCSAVCFGFPVPSVDIGKSNGYVAEVGKREGLYPLMLAGKGLMSESELKGTARGGGFFGYKVFLNWIGNNYGSITVEDLLSPVEMKLANDLEMVVLLHVPRDGRLADPVIQQGVEKLSKDYPRASIVLAHVGRAYLPDEMKKAIGSVKDLPNVYLDTAMVMDPTVLQIVFDNIDSKRVVFATDLPVAAMRGRRVYVMDHWVDVVLEGYPESAYRMASDGIRATYMVYEIVLAIRRAAEMSGLSRTETDGVLYGNGMALLKRVMGGELLKRKNG